MIDEQRFRVFLHDSIFPLLIPPHGHLISCVSSFPIRLVDDCISCLYHLPETACTFVGQRKLNKN